MTDNNLYIQCTLKKGAMRDVCWIPQECAKLNAVVSFDDPADLWIVTTVGTVTLPWSAVNERSRDWKRTRAASDI